MNRHERRATRAKQPKSSVAVITQSFRDAMGQYYWFVKPEGWTKDDGVPWRYVTIHGPFATDAEAGEHQRLFLLGPQCTVTEAAR